MPSCFHTLSAYNGTRPAKTATWPKYNYYRADEKYQDIARMLGLPCSTPEEAVEAYAKAVYELGERCGIQMNFKAQGIDEKNGRNIHVNWPSLLTKTNVHQLTHVFQWLTICKKSSKILTMVTKNVQDVVNKTPKGTTDVYQLSLAREVGDFPTWVQNSFFIKIRLFFRNCVIFIAFELFYVTL